MAEKTSLFVSPLLHLKGVLLCQERSDEIAGIAVCHPDDPFYLLDLVLCEGVYSSAYCDVEADDLARCMEKAMSLGYPVETHTGWFHTHPFNSPKPSGTDETTFNKIFGQRDIITQIILCKTNEYYAATSLAAGQSGHRIRLENEVYIHYDHKKPLIFDPEALRAEAKACSRARKPYVHSYTSNGEGSGVGYHIQRYARNPDGTFTWAGRTTDDSEVYDEDLMEWVPKAQMDSPEIVSRRASSKKNTWTREHDAALRRLHHKLFLAGEPDDRFRHLKKEWEEWTALIKRCCRWLQSLSDEEAAKLNNPGRLFPVTFKASKLPTEIKKVLQNYVKGLTVETTPADPAPQPTS